MKNLQIRGEVLLTITSLLWGASFVAQRIGMNYIGPFTFTASRFLIGALSLIPVIFLMDKINAKQEVTVPKETKSLLVGGIACGVALFSAISFQQIGLIYTTAGKAGFITALYIVLVPLLGLFLHKKVEKIIWFGVALAVIGLYLLCVKDGSGMSKGDLIVLCGTFFWAIHILTVDHFVQKVDSLKMSFLQFLIAGIISLIVAAFSETIIFSDIVRSAGPILFTGIFVVGIAYTLQILGQKDTNPTIAALILSMESVFAVISGMIFLGEQMSAKEVMGCILMFSAVIITELKPSNKNLLDSEK
ncbi:MAG: DMT family transporter [Aminipila sp.]